MPLLLFAFLVLTALALLVVIAPIVNYMKASKKSSEDLSALSSEDTDIRQANLLLFEDRLAELGEEMQAGKISASEFSQLKTELGKSLLNDVGNVEQDKPNSTFHSASNNVRIYALGLLGLVGIPLVTVGMYTQLGSYQPLQQAQWTEETRALLAESANDTGEMLQQLESKLAANPQHIEGWVLLGRSYLSMQRYPESSRAFEQLIKQLEAQGENPAVGYGLLAQSIYFATDSVTPGVQSAVNKALAADPAEGNALSLLGIAAFQQGRYQDAIDSWQKILTARPNDPNAEALRSGVARAHELMAANAATASAPLSEQMAAAQVESGGQSQPGKLSSNRAAQETAAASVNDGQAVELEVNITLPAQLHERVAPGDMLFVLARPVGARMPLVVTRRSASELPLTVTLNDAMAMGPMAKLSSAEQVEVVARVSKSGTPQPQSGDIEGVVGPIQLRSQQGAVTLSLDRVVP